jgi:hypothetical protein
MPPTRKEHLRRQHDAREVHRQRLRGRVEAGELQRDERRREPPEQRRGDGADDGERPEHRGEQVVGGALVAAGEMLGVERQKGDRQRAAGEQIVEQVGDLEGGIVGIGGRSGADSVGEQRFSRIAEHARQQHARRQQQRRRAHTRRLWSLRRLHLVHRPHYAPARQ